MSYSQRHIEDALAAWARDTVEIPWVLAYQDGPIPARPFGTILVEVEGAIGHDESKTYDAGIDIDGYFTVDEEIRAQRLVTVSINVFGECAANALERLRASACRPSTSWPLPAGSLAFTSASGIRNLSTLVAERWEERAQADFRFAYAYTDTKNLHAIHSVEVVGAPSPAGSQLIEVS